MFSHLKPQKQWFPIIIYSVFGLSPFFTQCSNFVKMCFIVGSSLAPKINKNKFKTHSKYHWFFDTIFRPVWDECWLHFGSPGGSKGPLFSSQNRFCGSSGDEDGARQGTPGDPEAPKMELQGSQNGAPEAPRALKREPRRPSDIPKIEPERVQNRAEMSTLPTLPNTATTSLTQKGGAAVCHREASSIV